MLLSANPALWFLIVAAPICVWAAWSDMKTMKIPNKSVWVLVLAFAVTGVLVLPMQEFLWRWAHLAVILVVGFVMNMARMIGAGDAKFAAAMAPFVALPDAGKFAMLFSVVLVLAFLAHRIARATPAVKRAAPGWESWERRDFPMGLALGTALIAYLAIAATYP
ncbi:MULTISPECIES: A24 family peptidase [Actibacterium]|uniref:Prepilin peptidase CpaA n=1 Tax=Actibacterium naphthalenivorans TaxID=1614693 RepID=A0A840CEE0_9RHOB|nr:MULTISPECIES: prepilin peptidase [Actibacterium]ALG89725.1 membrane protein [Actibacterium sp. EMB200-NS6]MBB4020587.1 prepilin peptidase CpaA [Actibacterium naphthalenivorans]